MEDGGLVFKKKSRQKLRSESSIVDADKKNQSIQGDLNSDTELIEDNDSGQGDE